MKLLTNPPSIKRKIFLLGIFSSLIPLVIISIFSFIYFSNMEEKKALTTTTNFLNIVDWNIDNFLTDIESIGKILLGSTDIQEFLTQQNNDLYSIRRDTSDLIVNVANNKPYINSIYIGNESVEYTFKNHGTSRYSNNIYNQIKNTEIIEQIIDNKGKGILFESDEINLLRESNSITYGKVINDINKFNQIGILLISFDENVFEAMFDDLETTGSIIVTSNDSNIIYNKNPKLLADNQIFNMVTNLTSNGVKNYNINKETFVTNNKLNVSSGFKIISVIPYQEVINEATNVRDITLFLMILSFLIVLIFAYLITKKITKQLNLLAKITNKLEERKQKIQRVNFDVKDEIGKIGNRLIYLYNRNNDLLVQLYESKLKAKESELFILQSHINPHFLYNTLNSIYWMAEKYKIKPIADMALNMSDYYKMMLNNGHYITTIQDELLRVQRYFEIMNVRHANKLNLLFDIDSKILEKKILKLLVQPLVENAINHGLPMKEGNKNLTIEGYTKEDLIYIDVIDNGVGFDYQEMLISNKGYALKNINERIKLYYGQECGLFIESKKDQGTTARIIIRV
ncbi:sensor histidine kinase [Gracilibacillus massiliensis]|uniref:sensor histidine kinase n=1 Tax=Gracilibacillus massiliensis TaxID=1564956 RepID=UPI001E32AC94|nr:histidine kinase [Gracilibacillus massiliensis]